jgi:hypothetical protein
MPQVNSQQKQRSFLDDECNRNSVINLLRESAEVFRGCGAAMVNRRPPSKRR